MKKLSKRALFGAAVLAALCITSCKDNNSGADGENQNIEARPGYEEGEAENAKGGNPSTGGDSTTINAADANLESGSGTRTGSNSSSESGSSAGSPHSDH